GARRVAAQELCAPEELAEQVGVAAEAAEEQSADGERERPEEQGAPPVGKAGHKPPAAERGGELEPGARSRERAHVAEQRVVVHQRDLGAIIGDGRAWHRDGIARRHVGAVLWSPLEVLLQNVLRNVREVRTQLESREAVEGIEPLCEDVADDETLDLLPDKGPSAVRQGRQVEVERLLRSAERPVEAVCLVDVDGEDLSLAQPAVDGAREHHRVVPQDVRQRDGGAAEEAASEVVALIPYGRS